MANLSTYYPAPITAADLGLSSSDNVTFGSIQNTPIGSTTPAAGSFTTLEATTTNVPDGSRTDLPFRFTDDTDTGIYRRGTNTLTIVASGNNRFEVSGNQVRLAVDSTLNWVFNDLSGSPDLTLVRDASNTLAQVRGTNAQTFNIYNTYTSSTNYERGFLKWDSNVFQIGTEKGSGGGTARTLVFQTDGATRITIPATSRQIIFNGDGRISRQSNFGGIVFAASNQITINDNGGSLVLGAGCTITDSKNIVLGTTAGTQIGTATNQLLGFYGVTPVDQPDAILGNIDWDADGTGGGGSIAVDVEAREAIYIIRERLQELGLVAAPV